ncbi:L-dopachrome tautomerase-related protein [Methylobacterium sp. NEAU 140]|uniref:SMP-30/gluconolactonase/LRE family protein n=1 Tax=Methylobacterium sp. NEAU 140 TaxID=3064945 RepID=UPI00273452C3|nr:L-dopachrome tautomerase-related protein [Methylobacterium sp. NEAU 140]MDP4022495.1 L-dopachrome tautomerase-related protein [Methylobacterium sp. NEAU 140]
MITTPTIRALSATLFYATAAPALAQEPSRPATPAPTASPGGLTQVARFDHQVTGVTVTKDGRIFVNFPRWTEDAPVSVAELKDGKPVPYPNAEWNAWRNARKDTLDPKTHFVCVQSVVADPHDRLWVVDAAAPAMAALVKDGPKLVGIDLKTNAVTKTIAFDPSIAPQGSYLNDVRISPDGKTAYLTDSGAEGALIVVDIDSGSAKRLLAGAPATMPDKSVTVTYDGKPLRRPDGRGVEFAADGIALSPDGGTLYWQAIKGKTLYSLPTDALTGWATAAIVPESLSDRSLTAKIATIGENGPADGLIIARSDGRMYVTSPQDDAIKVRELGGNNAGLTTLVQDPRLRWPDTFSEGPDGTLYVTTSHIQDSAFYRPDAPISLPTELWSFKPSAPR